MYLPQVLFTTSKSLDSKSLTPISIFFSVAQWPLSFISTSRVYDLQEFRCQEPDSYLFFLYLPQVLFTTPKSLDSRAWLRSLFFSVAQWPLRFISTSLVYDLQEFRFQEPDSYLCFLYLPQVLFTTSKSLDSKSQTPISIFVLLLNGLYVSSPQVLFTTSKSLDSKSQTRLLSLFFVSTTSPVYDPQEFRLKSLTPISIFFVSKCPLRLIAHKSCLRPPRV